MNLRLYNLTLPQIEYYRTFCNFDEKERELFELRVRNTSLEKCAEILHYDGIKKISSRVNRKIIDMTNAKKMNDWIENVYWKNVIGN